MDLMFTVNLHFLIIEEGIYGDSSSSHFIGCLEFAAAVIIVHVIAGHKIR